MGQHVSIAVVIPVYNGAAYLAETIESVLGQSYAADDVLIVDDGSRDGSAQVVRGFGERVRLIEQSNAGVSAARNYGAGQVTAEWIHFLDQDDVWEPEHLASQVREIERWPEADVVYAGRRLLTEEPRTQSFRLSEPVATPSAAEFPRAVLERNPYTPSSVCLRRSTFLQAGGFDGRYDGAEDWDLFLRLNQRKARFVATLEPTVRYRVHAGARTNNPLPMLTTSLGVVRQDILPQMAALQRVTRGRRIISRLEGEAAILLRELGLPGALPLMLRSIVRHPLHEPRRYKIAAHMLLHGQLR
jgi:glycosyltransferase involved in cell wall biosynthesis